MKFITIEEHIKSNEILTDIKKERLKYMDEAGIAMQVLSYMNQIDDDMPNDKKTELCIKGNNSLNEKINKYPDGFSAFADIPLWDVDASVKELERCIKELGVVGALVMGKIDVFCPGFLIDCLI